MHSYKKIIGILLLLVISHSIKAQVISTLQRIDFMSPQAADFVKYGNVQPSLYTGQLGLNIPLFQIKDNAFNIDVSLNNNSGGFMPTQASGPVGMNWYLSVGGAITRKVNGYPDDYEANPSAGINGPSYLARGFYLVAKSTPLNKDNVFNFLVGNAESTWVWNVGYYNEPYSDVNYDYEPDEFTFNVMGHSGTFFIANDGTPRVISNENIKIDLTSMTAQSATLIPVSSEIVLTTSDGYKYYFGGDPTYLEYSFPLNSYYNPFGYSLINTWNLSKVVTPWGKELVYTYKSFDSYFDQDSNPHDHNHYILHQSTYQTQEYHELNNVFFGSLLKNYGGFNATGDNYSVTKTSFLEKIESDNFSLKFEYSEKANNTIPTFSYGYAYFNQKTFQLDAINYYRKEWAGIETLLSSVAFNYNYLGGGNPRHFLTSIQESGKNPYVFSYYNDYNLPTTYTHGIDHWGYWNGFSGYTELDMIPDIGVDPSGNGDVTISGTKRAPNAAYSKTGMLKRIVYPTGGYSEFEYEANNYSKRLERTAASAFLPATVTVNGDAGGVRISKISDYNGTALENVREFIYKKDYVNSGTTSSGFLLDYPRYLHYWEIPGYYVDLRMRSSSFNTNYNVSEPFINYSEITEVKNGLGYKVYKFSNYESNPDIQDYNEKELATTYFTPINLYKNFIGFKLNNRARDRGKLLATITYDVSNNPVSSTTNTYTTFNSATAGYTVGILACSGSFAQSYKIYEDIPHLTQTTNVLYNSGQQLTTTENFLYDSYGQVSQKTSTSSKGETLETTYQYPYDFVTLSLDPLGTYLAMKNLNIVSPVIAEIAKRANTQIGYTRNEYYTFGTGVYRTQSLLKQRLSSDPLETIANYVYSAATGWNPQSITRLNGVSNSYIWGYNKQYPIAEIKAALVNEVAHTSFEEPLVDIYSTDDWQILPIFPNSNYYLNIKNLTRILGGRTGLYACNAGSITSKVVPQNNYILTLWAKGSGTLTINGINQTVTSDWKLYTWNLSSITQVTIDNPSQVSIDELRLLPPKAQIETYTYLPLVGMASSTDSRGQTTYYEYDSFQRLLNVKDKDRNIIKRNQYHYKN